MKRNRLNIAIGAVLILIFGSLLFVFQVRKSQVAVVTLFGKPDRVQDKPGAYFKWPWPIEKVYTLDQRIQNFEGKFEETKLPDQYTLLMLVYVGWKIEDPKNFFPKFVRGSGDGAEQASIAEAEKALEAVVRSAKNEVAGQHIFSDFVSAEEKQSKFTQIEDEILHKVQDQLRTRQYGIEIKFVQIKKLGLPESVTQDVFARMQSERQVRIAEIQFGGEELATKIKSAADRTASELLAKADAEALQLRGEGEAAAMKSLSVLQQNPDLANLIMKLNALEQMLKEKTTLILDQNTSPLDLLQATKTPRSEPLVESKK